MQLQKRKHGFVRGERGQSLVELAISLPIILVLLLGTFDFGMAIFSYSMLRDAAQEGALYGSFNPANKAEIERRSRNISPQANAQANEGLFSSPVELRSTTLVKVTIQTFGDPCQGVRTNGAANSIRVSVSYGYKLLMPFGNNILASGTIPLTATATNVILQPACP
ncbi:MAG: pilus assembly protein [Chloroflexi bacterium]|nr:pilus assembly protein [Chloroflexota bacterium]